MSEKHLPGIGGNFDRIIFDGDGTVWVPERTCYSERSDGWECSECGFLDAYVTADFINYCPNCGARVVGE